MVTGIPTGSQYLSFQRHLEPDLSKETRENIKARTFSLEFFFPMRELFSGYERHFVCCFVSKKKVFRILEKRTRLVFCFIFLGYLDRRMKTADHKKEARERLQCCFVLLNVIELNVRTKNEMFFYS